MPPEVSIQAVPTSARSVPEVQLSAYNREFGFVVVPVDRSGRPLEGIPGATDCDCGNRSDQRRLRAIEQTRLWGETIINLCCDNGYAMWGVPLIDNNELVGGLIVQGVELEGLSNDDHGRVQQAAHALHHLAIETNCIPRAEVELAQQQARKESHRFLAIEAAKKQSVSDDIRTIYLTEEPDLLSAIKIGDIGRARAILNHILTGVYGLAGERLELLKSAVLELVVMMSRAAVEAGADPATVLGRNYQSLADLAAIDDEEDLADWVRRMLETLIESIRTNDSYPNSLLMLRAVRYMQANLHKHLRRDEVARVAGVSPSHFSKLVSERMGRPFGQLLTQMRVNRAKELLLQTDHSLSEIATECGFFDQSHFNKSFRAATNQSPGEFRKCLGK